MKIIYILPLGFALLLLLCYIAAYIIFTAIFVRDKDINKTEKKWYERMDKDMKDISDKFRREKEYIKKIKHEEIFTESFDHLKLCARLYKNENSKKTVMMIHGYHSFGEHDFACSFEFFYKKLGYNVFIIDMRAHGKSEGKYITYGFKERYDILNWCRLLEEKYGFKDVVIYGISMGCAASILYLSLKDVTKNVSHMIADCGYTSFYEELSHILKSMKIPRFPVLNIIVSLCKNKAGFDVKDINTLKDIEKVNVPVLFIHGKEDDFIPVKCSVDNFDGIKTRKKLILVDNAIHGLAYPVGEALLEEEIMEFLRA